MPFSRVIVPASRDAGDFARCGRVARRDFTRHVASAACITESAEPWRVSRSCSYNRGERSFAGVTIDRTAPEPPAVEPVEGLSEVGSLVLMAPSRNTGLSTTADLMPDGNRATRARAKNLYGCQQHRTMCRHRADRLLRYRFRFT